MGNSEQDETMREIQATQVLLKESIEESRRLTAKTQTLIDKHREQGEPSD